MGTLGFWEIVVLAVLALLIFGPEKLPEIAQTVGKTLGRLRREASATLDELKRSADYEEFKGVAGELRSATDELRKTAVMTGPMASAAGAPRKEIAAPSHRDGPPPFDPDAT